MTRNVRWLLRRKITLCNETLYIGGPSGSPETSNARGIYDGGTCADADGTELSGSRSHCRFMLGDADFHQGLGPHTHQGGAQCMEHHFHEWPWKDQDSPQFMGKGPNLVSWQGASLRVL